MKLVKPCVDFIDSLQFPSGNYPSSLGRDVDRLIHWCHGAPGVIYMLTMAYEVILVYWTVTVRLILILIIL